MKIIENIQSLVIDGYKLTRVTYFNKEKVEIQIELMKVKEIKKFDLDSWDFDLTDYFNKTFYGFRDLPFLQFEDLKFFISGWEFSNFKITFYERELIKRQIKAKLRFNINLEDYEENQDFNYIDLREKIEFKYKDQLLFGGIINYIHPIDPPFSIYSVYCEDYSCLLEIFKLKTNLSLNKNNVVDFFGFITELFELKDSRSTLKNLNTKRRDFTIIIPIIGVTLNTNIKIGKCLLTLRPEKTEFLKNNEPLFRSTQFAQINLKADSLYKALILGINFIQTVINLINFRNKVPHYFESYDYLTQNSIAKMEKIVYLHDIDKGSEMIINLPWYSEPILEKETYIQYHFRPLLGVGSEYINPEKEMGLKEQKIKEALYYISSAEEKLVENRTAAFLELWIAIDYIVSALGPKLEKQFTKHEVKIAREFCSTFIGKMRKTSKISLSEEEYNRSLKIQERLIQLIGSTFNQPPLRKRLDKLLEVKIVKLSNFEIKLYKSAREKRNDVIHGNKAIEISKDEYNVLSKIIYFILKEEIFKKIEIKERHPIFFENPQIPLVIRTLFDFILEDISSSFPNNKEIHTVRDKISNLSELGMPLYSEIGKAKTICIPPEFDDILKITVNELIKEHSENQSFLKCKRLFKRTIMVDDFDKLIKSILDNLVIGLETEYEDNELIKKARNQLDQLNRLGMQSFRIQNVLQGFERHKRFERLKK